MLLRCGNKTHMSGSPVKVTEDFINIINAVHQGFTNRYDKQTADELIVDCVRLVLLSDAEKREEAEQDLAKLLVSIVET